MWRLDENSLREDEEGRPCAEMPTHVMHRIAEVRRVTSSSISFSFETFCFLYNENVRSFILIFGNISNVLKKKYFSK